MGSLGGAVTTPLGSGSPTIPPSPATSNAIDPNHPDLAEVQRIADALESARWICPTYGPICTMAGDMELDPLHEPIGAARVRLGVELAPHNPNSLDIAAQLDARQGLWEQAARHFRTLISLWIGYQPEVIAFYTNDLHRPDLALEVEPNNYHYLQAVADSTSDPGVKQMAGARIRQLLIAACNGPNPDADELAALAEIREAEGDLHSCVDLYKRRWGWNISRLAGTWRVRKCCYSLMTVLTPSARRGSVCTFSRGCQAQAVLDAISTPPAQ